MTSTGAVPSATTVAEPSSSDSPNPGLSQSSNPTAVRADPTSQATKAPDVDPSSSSTPEKVKKRPSKVSLLGKRKNGSPSNSKREKSSPNATNEAAGAAANKDALRAAPLGEKRKGGFLAFLSCCSRSQQDEDIALGEHSVPVPVQTPSQQPTPVDPLQKQDNSAAESSTAESKEAPPEKVVAAPLADLKPVSEPEAQAPTAGPAERTTDHSADGPADSTRPAPESAGPTEEPVAVQAIGPPSGNGTQTDTIKPTVDTALDDDEVGQGAAASAAPADTDVEMRDAPPVDPAIAEQPPEVEEKKEDSTPPLPPPPPLDQRRQETARQADPASMNPVGGGEQPKWLLPPLRSEFKGKKCLVLDLDETLVHSSFKVRKCLPSTCPGIKANLPISDLASGRLHDPCGDCGSVPLRVCHQATWGRSVHEAGGRALRGCRLYRLSVQGLSGYIRSRTW